MVKRKKKLTKLKILGILAINKREMDVNYRRVLDSLWGIYDSGQ